MGGPNVRQERALQSDSQSLGCTGIHTTRPKKIARRWFVEPDAEYIGEQVKPAIFKTDNPKLKRILSGNG
ncbi:hypothetical protein PCI56_26710 [Plesiomonas shigelloides subsp. oncorhynchi]|nr:hypothetical protein [Plesiomonas shigelloides]